MIKIQIKKYIKKVIRYIVNKVFKIWGFNRMKQAVEILL